jgi:hypothetical protein
VHGDIAWLYADSSQGGVTMKSFRNKVADCRLRWIESPINSTHHRRATRGGLDSLDADQVTDGWSHWIERTENERRIRTGLTVDLGR